MRCGSGSERETDVVAIQPGHHKQQCQKWNYPLGDFDVNCVEITGSALAERRFGYVPDGGIHCRSPVVTHTVSAREQMRALTAATNALRLT